MGTQFDLGYYLHEHSVRSPLFKFRSCRDQKHTEALQKQQLWVSNALELNDPSIPNRISFY